MYIESARSIGFGSGSGDVDFDEPFERVDVGEEEECWGAAEDAESLGPCSRVCVQGPCGPAGVFHWEW